MEANERNDCPAAGVAVRAAAAQSQDAPAGLGDRAEEKRVLLQPGHGAGEGAGPGERDERGLTELAPFSVKRCRQFIYWR